MSSLKVDPEVEALARAAFERISAHLPILGREIGPFTWVLAAFVEGRASATPTHHAELGQRAVRTADIALQALERIQALLDEDCDETRVALYNPKATVGNIRRELEQADAELTKLQRPPAPTSLDRATDQIAIADSALANMPPYELREPLTNTEPRLTKLEHRVAHLERPIADRDAIAWEIGRSAGIRGDAEHLNPFRRAR